MFALSLGQRKKVSQQSILFCFFIPLAQLCLLTLFCQTGIYGALILPPKEINKRCCTPSSHTAVHHLLPRPVSSSKCIWRFQNSPRCFYSVLLSEVILFLVFNLRIPYDELRVFLSFSSKLMWRPMYHCHLYSPCWHIWRLIMSPDTLLLFSIY